MKNAIFATGAALVIAVLLSSPTFAQTPDKPATNAAPAPAPVAVEEAPVADLSIDDLILLASTPEDRARLMLRCAGPPPRPLHSTQADVQPASEPVFLAH